MSPARFQHRRLRREPAAVTGARAGIGGGRAKALASGGGPGVRA